MTQLQKNLGAWVEIAEGLYDFLTRRGTTIEYSFQDIEVMVPEATGETAAQAKWKINGTLQVRTWESSVNAHEND